MRLPNMYDGYRKLRRRRPRLRLLALSSRFLRWLKPDGVRALREPIITAIWEARWDYAGIEPWEIGTAQLWDKLETSMKRSVSIAYLHVCLDELVEDELVLSRYRPGGAERGGRLQRV